MMKKLYFYAIVLAFTIPVTAQVSEQEFQALKALYNATGGDSWTSRTGWENINTTATKDDVTTAWTGIRAIQDGHIKDLWLQNNNLTGELPQEIGDLEHLYTFGVSLNNLTGSVPSSLGNMSGLMYLTLSANNFTGTLPDIFESMALITTIRISNNQFTGELPPSLNAGNIMDFYCPNNNLHGNLPQFTGSTRLYRFHCDKNNFSGNIPDHYGDLPLQELVIYDNNLSGPLPGNIFKPELERLFIRDNYFTFAVIEPYYDEIISLANYNYSPGKKMPLHFNELEFDLNEPMELNALTLSVYNPGGNNNRYKWFRNNVEVFSSNSPSYTIPSAGAIHAGIYRFEVTNTVVTDLILISENITVSIIGVNEPPTDILLSKTDVDENYTGVAGTLTAVDPDEGDTHIFSLVPGNGTNDKDNNRFTINGDQLNITNSANFETTPTLNILISADDGNGGIFNKAFVITVNDVNEPPVWTMAITTATIDETAPNGTVVFTLSAGDPEGDPVTYAIVEGDTGGAFKIESNQLLVADNTKLNYDEQNSYSLTISATDGTLSSNKILIVNLNKIVNYMPEVEDMVFSLDENSEAGTEVGEINASDPDEDPLTITIIEGNELDAFDLSGKNLIVASAEPLDYETNPVFVLTINVTDGIANVQATVTINLNNLPDETGTDILSFSVDGMEGQPVIDPPSHTVAALISEGDISALQATYEISAGATSSPPSGTIMNFLAPQTITVTSEIGTEQIWTVTVNYSTGAGNNNFQEIIVYPNPANEYVLISGFTGNTVIRLTDISGKTVLRRRSASSQEIIYLDNLKPGIYLVQVESSLSRTVHKVIKR
ncbi:MAG TPA: T9SS type A sorting domain-containing protein [Bacteroidaceae bacterium]|nr:T9SS type A sorting domain-containing protein [Bacteroidaceae bacterium]